MGGLFARLVDSSDPALMRQALAWLYGFVRPHRRAIGLLLGLSLGASLLALAQPWLVKTLIDEGLLAKDYQTLWHMAAIMIGAGLLGTVLAGVNRYLHTRLSGRILFALRDDLYRHLQQLSPTFMGGDASATFFRGWMAMWRRFNVLPWTRCSRQCRR